MNDPGFPGQHTTATSANDQKSGVEIHYNSTHFKTIPGITKIVLLVLNFVGFICISVSGYSTHSRGTFFNTIAGTGFWFTGFMLVFYVFQIVDKFSKIPWLKIEMFFGAIWVVLYLIASCLASTTGVEAYSAAAFFGFCAMCGYGFDAFLKFRALRAAGAITLGARQITVTA